MEAGSIATHVPLGELSLLGAEEIGLVLGHAQRVDALGLERLQVAVELRQAREHVLRGRAGEAVQNGLLHARDAGFEQAQPLLQLCDDAHRRPRAIDHSHRRRTHDMRRVAVHRQSTVAVARLQVRLAWRRRGRSKVRGVGIRSLALVSEAARSCRAGEDGENASAAVDDRVAVLTKQECLRRVVARVALLLARIGRRELVPVDAFAANGGRGGAVGAVGLEAGDAVPAEVAAVDREHLEAGVAGRARGRIAAGQAVVDADVARSRVHEPARQA